MRPQGSKQALEVRQRKGVALRQRGLSVRAVAEQVGSVPSSVVRWTQAFERGGEHGLDSKPQAGGTSRFTARQKPQLGAYLRRRPRAYGWMTELWTLARVAKLIGDKSGVRYHISNVHRVLRAMGFSAQKPARLARERNDVAVAGFCPGGGPK